MIACELINPGLDRIDVRGDWRLSHLGATSSPYLSSFPPPLSPLCPFPPSLLPRGSLSLNFIQVSCPQFHSPGFEEEGVWGGDDGTRRCHQHRFPCLLDLLILLHLNFINCSTGPEAEKNENSLCGSSFFSLAPFFLFFFVAVLVRSEMISPRNAAAVSNPPLRTPSLTHSLHLTT